jgi:tetrahydromethanopterin S-methyltransferase subunit G
MEWYFAVWKPTVKNKGLINHYKILPKLDWFEKAVEAGKYEIFQKFSKEILNGITITYVNSIEEAIDDSIKHA